jgi:hypothetical protein
LAGKRWTDLTDDFLDERWSSFRLLSAEGYRYYLPAFLDSALRRFEIAPNFSHTVVYGLLLSSACSLYYDGGDERFDRLMSLFTNRQIEAVSAFLGLFAKDKPDHMTFLAARAMRWGWGRLDTPERREFEAFDRRMRSWEIPEIIDPDAEPIVRQIQEAFGDTPYPGDGNLVDSLQGDEPAECALELRGVRWQNAHPELLAANYTALSFLTAEGLRYFLPAYLVAELASPIESSADPVFALTHGFCSPHNYEPPDVSVLERLAEEWPILGSVSHMQETWAESRRRSEETDWFDYASKRMSVYSARERQAIVRYLQFARSRDEFQSADIAEALERYWLPSLAISETERRTE